MAKLMAIVSGTFSVTERALIPFVAGMLTKYRHVNVSWKPKDDTARPYKVHYSQPIK